MLNIGSFDGFRIFLPEAEIIPESQAMVDRIYAENRRFLENEPEKKCSPRPITGTFIYAHPPDYVGTPTLTWRKTEWNQAFQKLRKHGMDTVILQASVWNELEEVYYPSKMFSAFRSWNVVEPMLEAAKTNGLTVFLGGYGSVSGWNPGLVETAIEREIKRQTGCMTELLKYRELFDGIYYSPETAFPGKRDLRREAGLNRIYREYLNRIKELAPEKKILMSPASIFYPDTEQNFLASWQAILDGVPLDILAPQDSIGCGCCSLYDQTELWRSWHRLAQLRKLSLWANIELFERKEFGGPAPFVTASPERIAAQCRNVAPFAEKNICWEALYFHL